jgi:hypothetical protein
MKNQSIGNGTWIFGKSRRCVNSTIIIENVFYPEGIAINIPGLVDRSQPGATGAIPPMYRPLNIGS